MKRKGHMRGGCGPRTAPGETLTMLIFAGVSLLIAIIVRFLAGSPRPAITYGNLSGIIPPVAVMTLLWMVWYILLGMAFGSVLYGRFCCNEVSRYKGGMLFVLMMSLGYVWYPLFFRAFAFFIALLICEAVLVLSFFVAVFFLRVRRLAGIVMLAFTAWMVFMTILNILALFAV